MGPGCTAGPIADVRGEDGRGTLARRDTLSPVQAQRGLGPLLATAGDADLFVGRQELVRRSALLAQVGCPVLLIGPAGSGRTSTLHQVERALGLSGCGVVFVDGAGADDAATLLRWLLRACSLGVQAGDADVPTLLADVPSAAPLPEVILIDDLEPAAADLFGRWRPHLWRLRATVVATAACDDPTLYLRGGGEEWWGDEVHALPPLSDEQMVELLSRRVGGAALPLGVTENWVREAAGRPRVLLRLLAAEVAGAAAGNGAVSLRHDVPARGASDGDTRLEPTRPTAPHRDTSSPPETVWTSPTPNTDELGASERRVLEMVRRRGRMSLADSEVIAELAMSYGYAHKITASLASRGLLTTVTERSGGQGRPRVVFMPAPAPWNGPA